jgi:hypothetical protein
MPQDVPEPMRKGLNDNGCDFVISRPNKELDELAQPGIWQGPVVLQELAGLELQRRRPLINLVHIDSQSRGILRDLKLTANTRNMGT